MRINHLCGTFTTFDFALSTFEVFFHLYLVITSPDLYPSQLTCLTYKSEGIHANLTFLCDCNRNIEIKFSS